MITLPCPSCGPRGSDEFHYAGTPTSRPAPAVADPATWRAYLYDQANPSGWTTELWRHSAGCGRFLLVERHRTNNEVQSP